MMVCVVCESVVSHVTVRDYHRVDIDIYIDKTCPLSTLISSPVMYVLALLANKTTAPASPSPILPIGCLVYHCILCQSSPAPFIKNSIHIPRACCPTHARETKPARRPTGGPADMTGF